MAVQSTSTSSTAAPDRPFAVRDGGLGLAAGAGTEGASRDIAAERGDVGLSAGDLVGHVGGPVLRDEKRQLFCAV
jgi:hypothetical protein